MEAEHVFYLLVIHALCFLLIYIHIVLFLFCFLLLRFLLASEISIPPPPILLVVYLSGLIGVLDQNIASFLIVVVQGTNFVFF